jgi:hypothetical protein
MKDLHHATLHGGFDQRVGGLKLNFEGVSINYRMLTDPKNISFRLHAVMLTVMGESKDSLPSGKRCWSGRNEGHCAGGGRLSLSSGQLLCWQHG